MPAEIMFRPRMTARLARRYASAISILLAAGVGPLHPARVSASDASDAEDLIRSAVRYRREGKDQKAFPLLQRAYELTKTPRTAAQLGLVEMALGYSVESERHLTEAIAARDNSWIAGNQAVLSGALRAVRDKNAELRIIGAPAGAEVFVNGKNMGQLPLE